MITLEEIQGFKYDIDSVNNYLANTDTGMRVERTDDSYKVYWYDLDTDTEHLHETHHFNPGSLNGNGDYDGILRNIISSCGAHCLFHALQRARKDGEADHILLKEVAYVLGGVESPEYVHKCLYPSQYIDKTEPTNLGNLLGTGN